MVVRLMFQRQSRHIIYITNNASVFIKFRIVKYGTLIKRDELRIQFRLRNQICFRKAFSYLGITHKFNS